MKPSELKQLLTAAFKAKHKVLIKGPPGVGKSDIVEQACVETGADLKISHPAISDPTDYKGMPAVLKNGTAHFLPFGDLQELIDAKKPTVCFMDDIGQAPHGVQAALMQLILARRVNGHRVSDHVVFCGATNDSSHRAGVHSLLEPVKSRWDTIVELQPDVNDWCTWAFANHIAPEVIAFIRFRPKLLNDFQPTRELTNSPSPRSVAAVAKWVAAGVTTPEVIGGAAGAGFAAEFLGFLRVYQQLPSIDQILVDPAGAPVPSNVAAQYAVCAGLVARASKANVGRVHTYLARLPKEFEVCAVRDMQRASNELVNTREYTEWCLRNQEVLG